MYALKFSSKFKSSYKKFKSDKRFKKEVFKSVLTQLQNNEILDAKYQDHQLKGDMKNFRECHIAPNILLVYQKIDEDLILLLINIGSHSNLF